jgi:hypothetical protein
MENNQRILATAEADGNRIMNISDVVDPLFRRRQNVGV